MKKIFWQKDKVGMISDHLTTTEHSHWLIQLFLSLDGKLKINVEGEEIECYCITINHNVAHTFITDGKPYYTLVFGVTSQYENSLSAKLENQSYWIWDEAGIEALQQSCQKLVGNTTKEQYDLFLNQLREYLEITKCPKQYDKRIMELIESLEICDCHDHAIALFAKKVNLSTSRLAHLFKEETGIPLKSYIGLHQMTKAFDLLLNGQTITEAALLSGFDTPSHFATAVKRMTGRTATNLIKDSEILKV